MGPISPSHRSPDDGPRVDRSRISVGRMHGPDPDADFWLNKSPAERLAGLEACREAFDGRDAARGRVVHVLEVVRRDL
jgi:hypothetical protein